MPRAYVALLISALALAGCERSQVNYQKPKPANRYVFDYTGNEMAWWGVGGLILLLVDQAVRRDD